MIYEKQKYIYVMERCLFKNQEYLALPSPESMVQHNSEDVPYGTVKYLLITPLDLETGNIFRMLSVWDNGDIYTGMVKAGNESELQVLSSTNDADYALNPFAVERIKSIIQSGRDLKFEINKDFIN